MDFRKSAAKFSRNGSSKPAARQELLSQVASDRSAREAQRRRLKAAILIQKVYRGWRARTAVKQRLLKAWLQQYSKAAADVASLLPAAEVAEGVVAPMLQAFLCPLPPAVNSLGQPGTGIAVALEDKTSGAVLRGGLALLLRSIACPSAAYNFCALPQDKQLRALWLRQTHRLILLSSSLIITVQARSSSVTAPGATQQAQAGNQTLILTAAARLIKVLTDSTAWKCFQPDNEAACQACAEILSLANMPATVSLALKALLQPCPFGSSPTTDASIARQDPGVTAPADQQTPSTTATAQKADLTTAAAVNMILHAAVRPIMPHIPASNASTSASLGQLALITCPVEPESAAYPTSALGDDHSSAAMAWAEAFAGLVLTVPGVVSRLEPPNRTQLADAKAVSALLTALHHLAQPGVELDQEKIAGPGCKARQEPGAPKLQGPADAMAALGNTVQLLAGSPITRAAAQDAKRFSFLPKTQLLAKPDLAKQFLATAIALLQFVAPTQPGNALKENAGSASGVLQELWPLAEGTIITQLLSSEQLQASALVQVATLYHMLLLVVPDWERASGQGQGSSRTGLASALVSGLAFGCNILQGLWRWCAMNVGLPLEAPHEATRGWDVPSLRQGIQGLLPWHAAMLGLFCRVYAHVLLIMDDSNFHQKQSVFTLPQQRAIATSLNALVFRTYCPVPGGPPAHVETSQLQSMPQPLALLSEWAPVLLRGLYERHARCAYCPASLWLEPFKATQMGADFSAAAVVRALAQGQSSLMNVQGSRGQPSVQAALLVAAPQCIPFEQRLLIFRALVTADKERGSWAKAPSEGGPQPLKFTVHRDSTLQDGWQALRNAGERVKGRLVVSFVNRQGMLEAGLDYGGLVKEFLEQAIQIGFDANYGLFTSTPDGWAYPQPAASKIPNGMGLLEFLGLVVGKALYEGILLDMPLASFFVARLQGRRPMFDELSALDPDLHRSLVQLKSYEGDAVDLCLDFTIEDDTFGSRTVHSLLPRGGEMAVSNANKLHYIHLAADWHLNGRLGASSDAFARGLAQVIPASWLRMFNPREVNELLGGGESGALDVQDMAQHAQYSGGYSKSDATIKIFWKVLAGLSSEQHKAFMRFVTSCSRAPLGGFQHLNPPLTLHKVPSDASVLAMLGGKDVDRLPSASTCYNMLKLPNYRRASTLKEKLLYAITSNAGFELS